MEKESKQIRPMLKKALCIFMTVLMLMSSLGGAMNVFATQVQTTTSAPKKDNSEFVIDSITEDGEEKGESSVAPLHMPTTSTPPITNNNSDPNYNGPKYDENGNLIFELGKTTTFELKAYEINVIYFTPVITGYYRFTTESTGQQEIDCYDRDENHFFSIYSSNKETIRKLYAGEKYHLTICSYNDSTLKLNTECISANCSHESTTRYDALEPDCKTGTDGYTASEQCDACKMWIVERKTTPAMHSDENEDLLCDRADCRAKISVVKQGYCGSDYDYDDCCSEEYVIDNATYTLYDTGLLVIEGTGRIGLDEREEYSYPSFAEVEQTEDDCLDCVSYYVNDNFIKKIIIKEGITKINNNLFANLHALTEIELPSSLLRIASSAFANCENLRDVYIPENVSFIDTSTFNSCSSIAKFTVSADNKYFYSDEHGVLYKNSAYEGECILTAFPEGSRINSYTVAANVSEFHTRSLPYSVCELTFLNPDTDIEIWSYNVERVKGYIYSTAHHFFGDYGTEFISLDAAEVESVEINTLPRRLRVRVGDLASSYGLTLKINFDDGTSRVTSSFFSVSEVDTSSIGEKEVTVTIGDHTLTYTVEVYEYVAPELKTGETTKIELELHCDHEMYFTPAKDGTYRFNFNGSYADINIYNEYDWVNSYWLEESGTWDIQLNGGTTYRISVYSYSESSDFSVKTTCIAADCDHTDTTYTEGKAETCTEDGYTASKQCNECSMWLQEKEIISATHVDADMDFVCDRDGCGHEIALVKEGYCGYNYYYDEEMEDEYFTNENASFRLYETGLLIIEGTGSIALTAPWDDNCYPDFVETEEIEDGWMQVNDHFIKKIIIGEGITLIGEYFFRNLHALTEVVFPESLSCISDYAFNNCNNLKNVHIPANATAYTYTFQGCTSIEKFTVAEDNEFLFADEQGVVYYRYYDEYSGESRTEFRFFPLGNKMTSYTFPESVTYISFSGSRIPKTLRELTFLNPETRMDTWDIYNISTIRGYRLSTAENFARNYGIEFIPLDDVEVESVTIDTLPEKTSFRKYAEFSYNGLTLKVKFADGTSRIIRDSFTISVPDISTPGEKEVTITAGEYTLTYKITVYEYVPPVLTTGETTTIKLDADRRHYMYFTPAADGIYKLTLNSTRTDDTIIRYVEAAITEEHEDWEWEYGWEDSTCFFGKDTWTVNLKGGVKYLFDAYAYFDCDFSITPECIQADCIHEDTTVTEGKEATCTEDGYTASEQCNICLMWIETSKTIPASHTDEDGDLICDKAGCGASISIVKEGYCGAQYNWDSSDEGYETENARFTLYDTGVLVIEGTGTIGIAYDAGQDYPLFAEVKTLEDDCLDCISYEVDDNFIKKIVIKEGITEIGSRLFQNLHALTEVELPSSLRSIGHRAFYCCRKLTEVFIPQNVSHIDESAFNECTSIEKFTVEEGNKYYYSDDYGVVYRNNWDDPGDDCCTEEELVSTELALYPSGAKFTSYTVAENVDDFTCDWLRPSSRLREITFLNPETNIDLDFFYYLKTIYGYRYSTAEDAAYHAETTFVPIDKSEITSVEFESLPYKTRFRVGNKLTTAGLEIRLNYADGTSRTTYRCDRIQCDDSTAGEKTVTIYLGDFTLTYPVTFYEYIAPELTIGEKTEIALDYEESHDMYFTPAKTGTYVFRMYSNYEIDFLGRKAYNDCSSDCDDDYCNDWNDDCYDDCNNDYCNDCYDDCNNDYNSWSLRRSHDDGNSCNDFDDCNDSCNDFDDCDDGWNDMDGDWYYRNSFKGNKTITADLKGGQRYLLRVDSYNTYNTDAMFSVTPECISAECDHMDTTQYEAVEATCAQPGYTAGIRCNECTLWIEGHEKVTIPHIDEDSDYYCDVCGNSISDIALNTTTEIYINPAETTYLKFIPEESGNYTFYSVIDDSEVDSYGYICEEDKTVINEDDDSGESYNFAVTSYLDAGTVYYLGARFLSDNREGNLPVRIVMGTRNDIFGDDDDNGDDDNEDYYDTVSENGFEAVLNDRGDCYITNMEVAIGNAYANGGHLEIPATIEGHNVTGLDLNDDRGSIKTLSFPATVEFIPIINLIDNYFENLESITVDEENQYYKSVDGVLYNYDLTELIAVPRAYKGVLNLPDTVTNLDALKIPYAGNLTGITFGENADLYYDGYVLYNKDKTIAIKGINLKGDYVMPETVEEIGKCAFADLDELKSVKVSSKVTEITYSAFFDSDALESIELPENLQAIGYTAFQGCDSLKSVDLNEGLTRIEYRAFYNSGLEAVSLPSTLTNDMHQLVFANCTSLKSVDLGTGLTVVSEGAFAKCTALEEITFPANITEIDESAFMGTGIKTLTIPDNVIYVKDGAFSDCDSLKSVVVGNGTEMLRAAFIGCDSLETAYLGSGITDMEYCFNGCRSLKKIEAEPGFSAISGYAFEDCSSLSEVKLPESVQEIVYGSFRNCTSLDEFDLPDNLVSIGGHALDNTEWFNSLPDGEAYMQHALYTYKGVLPENYDLIVQDGTTLIADYAFEDEDDLKRVDLPDGFKYIGNYSFYNTGIQDIIIPDSLVKVDYAAFVHSADLTDVYYTGTEEQWSSIVIEDENNELLNANIHFNYVRCTHPSTETVPATTASCGTYGYTEGIRCTECNRYISGHKPIKDKHKDENFDGKCDNCNATAYNYEEDSSVYVGKGEKVYIKYFTEEGGSYYIGSHSKNASKFELYDDHYNLIPAIEFTDKYTDIKVYTLEKNKVYYVSLEHINSAKKGRLGIDFYRGMYNLSEGDYEYRITGNYVSISKYNGEEKNLTVPSTLGNVNVEWIDGRAFENKPTETLVLPETVTGLSYSAFYNNYRLKEVHLPESLNEIWSSAFDNCHSITDVYYNGTTDQFKNVRIEFNNESITNATIHCTDGIFETTFTVGDFEYRVDFMENEGTAVVTGYIGDGGDVVIPEEVNGYTVASIDDNVFQENDTVKSITIPKTVNLIRDSEFNECKSLERIYITDLAQWCTYKFGGPRFSNITLCLNGKPLTNAIIPEGVTHIRNHAFSGCTGLTNVEMPESLTYIGDGAFENCPDLERIQYRGTEEQWHEHGFAAHIPANVTVEFESGHVHERVASGGVAPGCETTGLTDLVNCSVCGAVLVEQEVIQPTGHSYTETITEATCTQAGVKTFTCDCGHSYTEFVEDAKDHAYGEWETVKEATNTEDGQWKRVCANDEEHVEYLTIPKGGHEFDTENPIITVAPDCENEGSGIYKCITEGHDNCGVEMTVTLPAAGHQGTVIHTAPGCMTPGLTAIYCAVCDTTTESTEIPALGYHNFTGEGVVTVEATCMAEGLMTYTCLEDGCNETHTEPIAKKEHTLKTTVAEATCSAEGTATTSCTAEGCDYKVVSTLAKKPHTISTSYNAPTCTEGAYILEKCDICGNENKNYITELPALGHSFYRTIEVIKEATCTENGEEMRQCTRCDKTEKRTTYAKGHSEIMGDIIEATCTEASIRNYTCHCGVLLFVEFIENPKGHAYGPWEVVKQPTATQEGQWKRTCANDPEHVEYVTVPGCGHSFDVNTFEIIQQPDCTTPGTAIYKCITESHENCGIEMTVSIPATGHKGEILYTAPGCETPGKSEIYCSVCKATVESMEIPATGHHDFSGEGKVTVEPTCITEGEMTYTCQADGCNATHTEPLARTEHDYSTTVTEATCTAKGSAVTVCLTDGCPFRLESVLEKKPHTISSSYTPPTCEADGYLREFCTADNCEYENIKTGSSDAAFGHSFTVETEIITPATCIEKGEKTLRCSRCDATETVIIPATGHNHKAGDEVKATCTSSGYIPYTCKNEGCTSSYNVLSADPSGHNEAQAVEENRTEATCSAAGKYDSVVYCSVCSKELSRETVDLELKEHTPAQAVEENRTESTCSVAGKYDSVVYCSVCSKELSRETVTLELKEHTPAQAVEENRTESTCSAAGKYDSVVYCSVCSKELSREAVTLELKAHTYTSKVTAPTCTAKGYTTYTCACGDTYTADEKAALGHEYSNVCDTTCNNCSAKRSITHSYKAATCTAPKTCTVCKATTGKANGHKYTNACDTTCNTCNAKRSISHSYTTVVTTKATLTKNGKLTTKCTVCGAVKSTSTVYYPKTITLSATSYVYNGKTKTPTVTVKDSKGNTLKKDTDYTVKYASGRKSTGKYSVTITFKGKYSGTKTLYFTIVPKAVSLSTVTAGSKQATVTWKTVTGASGYEVMYSTSSKFKSAKTATVSGSSSKKATIKSLKKGKTYYFKVRAYKTVNGTKLYGAWSSVKSVKVK